VKLLQTDKRQVQYNLLGTDNNEFVNSDDLNNTYSFNNQLERLYSFIIVW